MQGKKQKIRYVFTQREQKTGSVVADVASVGRLCHKRLPATGKARSPTVTVVTLMVVVILLLTMASAILQDILSDVEQFQSEVNSVLTAEQLDADSIQQLLNSDVIAKIDLPEHIELQRVTTALYLFVTNSAAAWHSNYEQMLLVKKH